MDHLASKTSHITISGCEMHHYPLVNICKHTKKIMQHHHVEWVNQLCSYHFYGRFQWQCLLDYQAGYPPCRWNFNGLSLYTSPHGFPMGDTVHPRKISVRLRIQSLIMTMEDGFNAPGRKTGGTWWIEWAIKITNIHPWGVSPFFKPMFSIKMKRKPIGFLFMLSPICLLHRDAVDSHIYDGWFPSWNHSFDFFCVANGAKAVW